MHYPKTMMVVIAAAVLCLAAAVFAGVPEGIGYQGRVFDGTGQPVNGNVSLTFVIYDTPDGATSFWSETQPSVSVSDGYFSVNLGSVNPIPDTVFNQPERYLGITVGTDEELAPRIHLQSVPYAYRAGGVETFSPGPLNEVIGNYGFAAGDSNTVNSDYGSIAGGYGNMLESVNEPDTLLDTTMIFDSLTTPLYYEPGDFNQYLCSFPPFGTPIFIGGGFGNVALGVGSGVGWGGLNNALGGFSAVVGGASNYAEGPFSYVGGGFCNQALIQGRYQVVNGGYHNWAHGTATTIGGGLYNESPMTATAATIGGGYRNLVLYHVATVAGGYGNIAQSFGTSVGGGMFNKVTGTASTVAGGYSNSTQLGDYQFVGGGQENIASYPYATIAGGLRNEAYTWATVGGGQDNLSKNEYTFIGGGLDNEANMYAALIGGGVHNISSNWASAVVGGESNTASGYHSFVGAGVGNIAQGDTSTVAGGNGNFAGGSGSTIGGGIKNVANAAYATSSGGSSNQIFNQYGTIAGGYENGAASDYGAVGGGTRNRVGPGVGAVVPGGVDNAAMSDYCFAAGVSALSSDSCSFVWSDCCIDLVTLSVLPFYSNGPRTFNARATGGFFFATSCDSMFDAAGTTPGVFLPSGGSQWLAGSDRNLKENIREVDGNDLLNRIATLPVYRWNYKAQDPSIEHIGPIAQDFYKTFEIGDNNKTIAALDPAGIALAAIKELNKKTQELEAKTRQIEELQEQLSKTNTDLDELKQVVKKLAEAVNQKDGTGSNLATIE